MFHTAWCQFILMMGMLYQASQQQLNAEMTAYVDEGYYYSHRCQITIEIVSNCFQTKYQLFHILAMQNANFFNTTQISSTFYIKGTNSMEAVQTSSQTYCKFPMSSTYYCPFISLSGYDPYGLNYLEPVNSTYNKLTIRLTRAICPQEGKTMSFRVQMPAHSDYSSFYMFTPSITNTTSKSVSNLSFVYDKQVIVNVSNLSYKQVKSIDSIEQNSFLIGCQFNYPLTFRIDNASYYNSWDQINVYVSSNSSSSLVELSTNCQSNLVVGYSCTRTSYGYQLILSNQSNMVKSYEIANQQYYDYPPFMFTMTFGMEFIGEGGIDIEVVVMGMNNTYQEAQLNMTHNTTEIYGRKIFSLTGYNQQQFAMLTQNKYDSSLCINNSSANSTNNTNNNTNPTFDTATTSFQISQLIFIIALIVILFLALFFAKSVNIWEKLLFMITIFLLSVVKILYLALMVDEKWLASSDSSLSDSLTQSSTTNYSLDLFILKYTFISQFSLNLLYFLNYLILIICSQQIHHRIKKFYGTKTYIKKTLNHIQNKSKINSCNLSSIIFTLISVISFLANFKIYALLILKLQVDTHPQSHDFKKYRFRNSVIYKIHCGHLGIDLLLEANVLIWLFMTIKNCQNQIFTIILYIVLLFYCIHVYLMTVVLKSFILMAIKTEKLNFQQKNKLKYSSSNLQAQLQLGEENDPQTNNENVKENSNPITQNSQQIANKPLKTNLLPVLTQQIDQKSSKLTKYPLSVQSIIKYPSLNK